MATHLLDHGTTWYDALKIAKKSWDDGGKDIPEETQHVEDLPSDDDMGDHCF